MAFVIYPDASTAALLAQPAQTPLHLASGAAASAFVPLALLVGPDLSAQDEPTTFIRIALSGAPVPQNAQPKIELLARDPGAGASPGASVVDPNTAIAQASAVTLSNGAGVVAASAYFVPPFADNVYLLKVPIAIPDTRLWLRITNTTGATRDVVWVVADNVADTEQPWVHATFRNAVPVDITFQAATGQPDVTETLDIVNRGTGSVTVAGITPVLPTSFRSSGLPMMLKPNQATAVKLTFDVPTTPLDVPRTGFSLLTTNKVDPGPFGQGHNNRFTVSARAVAHPPSFGMRHEQFSPAIGPPERFVTLSGNNFAIGNVSVSFGTVAARIIEVAPSFIRTQVPAMNSNAVRITVKTGDGSVTSDDFFDVTKLPEEGLLVPPWHNKEEIDNGDDMGMSVLSAESLGLDIEYIVLQREPGYEHEEVVSTDPPAGTRVEVNSTVRVTINLMG